MWIRIKGQIQDLKFKGTVGPFVDIWVLLSAILVLCSSSTCNSRCLLSRDSVHDFPEAFWPSVLGKNKQIQSYMSCPPAENYKSVEAVAKTD